MEEEAFFLFVVHRLTAGLPKIEGDKEVHAYTLDVRRVTLQKGEKLHPGDQYKRLHIDFDPLQTQVGYLVTLYAYREEAHGRIIVKDGFHFVSIVQTEKEALEVKKQTEEGNFKNFLVKRQKFDRVEVSPVLIAKN